MSSTFNNLTDAFTIEYDDGTSASGYLAKDTVSIAGLSIQNQVFGDVTHQG